MDDYDADTHSLADIYARAQTLQRARKNTEAKREREKRKRDNKRGDSPSRKYKKDCRGGGGGGGAASMALSPAVRPFRKKGQPSWKSRQCGRYPDNRGPNRGGGSAFAGKTNPQTSWGEKRTPPRRTERLQMSQEEKNRLLAAGLCFKCKEPGHLAKDCPSTNFIKSDKRNGPPGVQAGLSILEVQASSKDMELPPTDVEDSTAAIFMLLLPIENDQHNLTEVVSQPIHKGDLPPGLALVRKRGHKRFAADYPDDSLMPHVRRFTNRYLCGSPLDYGIDRTLSNLDYVALFAIPQKVQSRCVDSIWQTGYSAYVDGAYMMGNVRGCMGDICSHAMLRILNENLPFAVDTKTAHEFYASGGKTEPDIRKDASGVFQRFYGYQISPTEMVVLDSLADELLDLAWIAARDGPEAFVEEDEEPILLSASYACERSKKIADGWDSFCLPHRLVCCPAARPIDAVIQTLCQRLGVPRCEWRGVGLGRATTGDVLTEYIAYTFNDWAAHWADNEFSGYTRFLV
ncbi:hypothetical protein FISHEDRAFT_69650 [Fistulina hepatica ATCC 64428]|uniref:CCHC-type domain-containing protein n=1 Tax=Fistulina hepatica ATCC 64428 TaxID=1128425 RepID=A0A0D7ALK7_9AGAR|nr:hypothetical protein FISHEDRAFT_69650 [Fistulina hepatica ATCC 64428]